ncbi:MAG: tyrosine-protein phosphatase, partial [Clostridia bacterium]|nr:tyrosine-protein phosphatase [Clostridia bacterium]
LCICLAAGALSLTGCGKKQDEAPVLENCSIIHEPEFGGIYITNTIEEFNALGFEYGDSVNITFSNGYELTGLPCYNGYYTKNGDALLVAYPGYDYIKAAINNGDDLWEVAGLAETDTAAITLGEKGAFSDIQKARDIHYTDERTDYKSDEIFANFRAIDVTGIKKNFLYRSASPCDNQHNRASFTDSLMKAAGVEFILNLSDNDEKIKGYMSKEDFASPYFKTLYEGGNVKPIALNMNFASDEFKEKIADGFAAMIKSEGPCLIHCTEGKDRTGFVCMLLEALAGTSYDEIAEDYMITYANYYNITQTSDPERYTTIVDSVLNPMIQSMTGDENANVKTADLSSYAENFLKDAGMTGEQIAALKEMISPQ